MRHAAFVWLVVNLIVVLIIGVICTEVTGLSDCSTEHGCISAHEGTHCTIMAESKDHGY